MANVFFCPQIAQFSLFWPSGVSALGLGSETETQKLLHTLQRLPLGHVLGVCALNFIFITNAFVVYALYAVTVAELKARQPNQKVLPLLNYFHSCSYCRCSHCVFRFLFVFSLLFHWPRSFLLFAVPLILFCFALQITFFLQYVRAF